MHPRSVMKEPFKCATYHPHGGSSSASKVPIISSNISRFVPANCTLIPYRLKVNVPQKSNQPADIMTNVKSTFPNSSSSPSLTNNSQNKPLAMVSPLLQPPQYATKAVQTDAWSIDLDALCPLEDYARSLRIEGVLDTTEHHKQSILSDHGTLRTKYEELERALRIQTAVNRDIKKLLVASVGTDFAEKIETLTREISEAHVIINSMQQELHDATDRLDRVTIECDLWKSKFVAGRMMLDEMASWKACISARYTECLSALQSLLQERQRLCEELSHTRNYLLCAAEAVLPPHNQHLPQAPFDPEEMAVTDSSTLDTPSWMALCRENRHLARSLCLNIPGTRLMDRLSSIRSTPATISPHSSQATLFDENVSVELSDMSSSVANLTRTLLKSLQHSECLSVAERAALEVLKNHLTVEVDPTGRYRCAYNSLESQTFERLTTACCKGCQGETFIL